MERGGPQEEERLCQPQEGAGRSAMGPQGEEEGREAVEWPVVHTDLEDTLIFFSHSMV